jgi:hypothetical protein
MMIKPIRWSLPVLVLATACHARAADAPRPAGPTIDIEVDDHEANKTSHVARLAIVLAEGRAKMTTRDSGAHYKVVASTPQNSSRVELTIERTGTADADIVVESALAAKAGDRVLLARVDRADGRMTLVTAQYH